MLDLPFFEPGHRNLASRLTDVVAAEIEPYAGRAESADVSEEGRRFLRVLGAEGLLSSLVPSRGPADLRTVCLIREALAAASGVADSVFAVHGLGVFPLASWGDEALRDRLLPQAARGDLIGAFAVTEPGAGSDVAAIATTAARDGGDYILDGSKTLISNAGIADFYIVFAAHADRRPDGRPRLSAFLVESAHRGLRVTGGMPMLAPHPIGDLELRACRVPASHRLGQEGDGFKVAFGTLEFFRPSVGAAACGMAARALREATRHALGRRQFGRPLAEFQATRMALADMQVELDAARLLVYRAAWLKDRGAERITRESSAAKLFATEAAQRIVDRAVQIHGGLGVKRGTVVERLYREVRALRIYEGTSEIQRLVIADQMLKAGDPEAG